MPVGDYHANEILDTVDDATRARHTATLAMRCGAASVTLAGSDLGGDRVDYIVEFQRREEPVSSGQICDREFGTAAADASELANRERELRWRLRD